MIIANRVLPEDTKFYEEGGQAFLLSMQLIKGSETFLGLFDNGILHFWEKVSIVGPYMDKTFKVEQADGIYFPYAYKIHFLSRMQKFAEVI